MKKSIQFLSFVVLLLLVSCEQHYIINKHQSSNVVLSEDNTAASPLIEEQIKPYRDSLKLSMDEVLNQSEVEMTIGVPEGNLGNFVADLVMDISEDYYENLYGYDHDIDFVLLNNGGLRTPLPKGDITREKVFELMPFENELVVITLSYEKTKELFDFVASKSDTNLPVKKGVPLSKDVKLTIKDSKAYNVSIDDEELKERTYRVVTSDYLSNGGDKMNFFLNPVKTEKLGIKLRDAILQYIIEENQEGEKLTATKDKRISYAK